MTIFALSSGHGKAGVAVFRVSGPLALKAVRLMAGAPPAPRRAALRTLRHPGAAEAIDRGLVLWLPGPASFTGEDMAEFHVHGGRAVITGMLAALGCVEGLRLAQPGEFTRRAFHNSKLDLTQAEGLADLIDAETPAQRRQALRQSSGALSEQYEGWREQLLAAMALVEAQLDFSDEEGVSDDVAWEARRLVSRLRDDIARRLDDGHSGELLREGLRVVIAGAPNAGKSSLLNALARRDVAIVSEEEGTTRDVIEVHLDLGGYPVILMDTAGVREAPGPVEREGVRRALSKAGEADLVLWLQDASMIASDGGQPAWLPVEAAPFKDKVVFLASKADLCPDGPGCLEPPATPISAVTGEGVERLIERLASEARNRIGDREGVVITRERHRQELSSCLSAIDRYLACDLSDIELRAEDLREAATALGRVTGRVDVEEVLDRIFAGFCIGK